MHIHLIGGSNTGMWDGWAHHFVIAAERDLGARVTNGFLGAVGSLFGLYRLDRLEREGGDRPDLVVFEYALNDIILLHNRFVSLGLLRDTLLDVADLGARLGIAIQFLCLEPRGEDLWRRGAVRRVTGLYEGVARRLGLPPPLSQREAIGRDPVEGDYLDELHLTPDASRSVAAALCRRVAGGLRPGPKAAPPRRRALAFADATRAVVAGNARAASRDMTVLEAPVVEMRRPSTASFPVSGRLAGVLFCATRTSGWYRIAAGGAVRRKNACESALSLLTEVVSLQIPRFSARARGVVEIAMPGDETELMRLAADRSPMPWTPTAPFADQEIALIGVVIWREAGLFAAIGAWPAAALRSLRAPRRGSGREPGAPALRLRYHPHGAGRFWEAVMGLLGSAPGRRQ